MSQKSAMAVLFGKISKNGKSASPDNAQRLVSLVGLSERLVHLLLGAVIWRRLGAVSLVRA